MSMKGPQEAVSVPSQINDLVEGVCVDYLHMKIEKVVFNRSMSGMDEATSSLGV